MIALVGTYTRAGGEGIYLLRLDPTSGALHLDGVAARVPDPSFLALHPSGRFLYAASELSTFRGEPGGAVSALTVDPRSGALSLLDQRPSGGTAPCHLSLDREGRVLLVANYGDGSVAALPVRPDGRLEPATTVRRTGAGPNPERQEGPHAHCVLPAPDGERAFVADLGTDQVAAYRLDAGLARLDAEPAAGARLPPGSGPRHLLFHPDGRRAWVVCELASRVVALDYLRDTGELRAGASLSTLPDDFSGENTAAALHLSPDARFLYVSNRGHDSVAVFRVDDDGGLCLLQHHPSGGAGPRDFAIDPTGSWMVVANERSGSLVTLAIAAGRGTLSATGHSAEVAAPVCVRFLAG